MPRGNAGTIFDALAPRYDEWCRTPLGRLTEGVEYAALREALRGLAGGEPLLEVGCGTGTFLIEAARWGARVAGVDASPVMVSVARAKTRAAGVEADLRVADGASLPFPSGAFRWVTLLLVLEFARDPGALLREASRVLAPDGTLVVAVLNRWSVWALVRRVAGLWRPSVYREARFFSRGELYRMLGAAGFRPEAWWGAVYYPPVDHPWLLSRSMRWEAWGRRWMPGTAAYLVVRARPQSAPGLPGGRAGGF